MVDFKWVEWHLRARFAFYLSRKTHNKYAWQIPFVLSPSGLWTYLIGKFMG